jgi:O-antigen ligase
MKQDRYRRIGLPVRLVGNAAGLDPRSFSEQTAGDLSSVRYLLRPVFWIGGMVLVGLSYALAGEEGMSIALSLLIALWALIEPSTALWMSTGFMVAMFSFFRRTAPHGEELPEELIYWGTGLLIISLGLVAGLFSSRAVGWSALKSRLRTRNSAAMALMVLVCLLASLYGLWVGNSLAVVARQLAGFALWFGYYFITLAVVRTHAEVDRLLRWLRWVVVAAAALYLGKLVLANLGAASWYREASHLAFMSGTIAVVVWNELLHAPNSIARLRYGAQFLCCVATILFMGSRASLGSLIAVATAMPFLLFALRKKHLATLITACCLLAGAMAWGPAWVERLHARSDLVGQMADRFLIVPQEDPSYVGRTEQWRVVLETVKQKPILGAGMGSEFGFFAPGYRWQVRTTFVDDGWGYLLLKTGLLGLAGLLLVLVFFFASALKGLTAVRVPRLEVNSISLLMILLYQLIGFLSGPTFFHFSGAAFVGTVFGCIVVLSEARQVFLLRQDNGMGLGKVSATVVRGREMNLSREDSC